jgi:tRNA-intron endonuclease
MSSPFPSPSPYRPLSTSGSSDNSDFPDIIEAVLITRGLRILVKESRFRDQLRNKGYGELEDSEYILRPYEALYLIYTKRLIIKSKDNGLDFNSLLELILKYDKDILTKFLIYRDIRSRGYIAKEGFGFGVDFRVYERGEFERKPAKYVIFGLNEGINITAHEFSYAIEGISKMGKEAVIAVIERRGGIIYYKLSKTRFAGNMKNLEKDVDDNGERLKVSYI